MKCPSCGRDIPDQSRFCGFCGNRLEDAPPSVPPDARSFDQPAGLPSFEVPPAGESFGGGVSSTLGSSAQPVSARPAEEPPAPPQPPASIQPNAQAGPQPVSASLNEGDVPVKKKSNAAVIVVAAVAGLAAVAGIALAVNRYVLPMFAGSGTEYATMAVLNDEDGMAVASGSKTLTLGEDTSQYSGWSALCYTTDGKRFVYFDDVENGLGTMYVGPAGGKAKEVDTDVVIGAVLVRPGAVMYQRQGKKGVSLCLYDGKTITELAKDDAGMGNWCCSDDGSFASYVIYDKGVRVGCYRYRGEDYTLAENTSVIYISPNGKAAYAADFGESYSNNIETLYALIDIRNTEAVSLGEDVGAVVIDAASNAVAFLNDYDESDGYGDLCYAKWGGKVVEIDNKVTSLRHIAYGGYMTSAYSLYGGVAYSISPDFKGELYYVRKDALLVTPFKAKRSVELIGDVASDYYSPQAVGGTLYWQYKKDLMSYRIGSLKEPEAWRPDSAADGAYILQSGAILSSEKDELFYQKYGSDGKALSLLEDLDDYDFMGLSPDEKYFYYMDYDELLFMPVTGGKEASVMDDIENVCMTNGGIYILADYDSKDGGDVYYVAYGKTRAVKIAEGIMSVTTVSYLS